MSTAKQMVRFLTILSSLAFVVVAPAPGDPDTESNLRPPPAIAFTDLPVPPSSTSTTMPPSTLTLLLDDAIDAARPRTQAPPVSTTAAPGTIGLTPTTESSPPRPTEATTPASSTTVGPSPTGSPASTTTQAPASTPSTSTTPNPEVGGTYRLVWSDEFDGGIDPAKWTIEHSTYGDGNHELQCYHPDNVTVGGGQLHLTAKPQDLTCPNGSARQFSSGMVRTRGLADWAYGRFEIRARVPEGQGLWPALWLSPVDKGYGRWPRSGELDIMEAIGQLPNRIIGSAHWYGDGHHQLSNREYWLGSGSFADGMHTFTMDWSPSSIVWLVDGVEYHRLSSWSAPAGFVPPAPFDAAFYLKMNLAVGGRSPGDPDDTTPWPASFDVDWVRVYQR